MSSRNLTIIVTNHSTHTFDKINSQDVEHGSKISIQGTPPLKPGGSVTLSVNGDSGCVGQVAFTVSSDTGVNFILCYDHPNTDDPTYVTVGFDHRDTSNDGLPKRLGSHGSQGWSDQGSYSGHDVTALVNLYEGVSVRDQDGGGAWAWSVPLAENPYTDANARNCADLANSVFQPKVRSAAMIKTWFNQDPTTGSKIPYDCADFTGGQVNGRFDDQGTGNRLIDVLSGLWSGANTDTGAGAAADRAIIQFLAAQLLPSKGTRYVLHVPGFTYAGLTDDTPGLPAYTLQGYAAHAFAATAGQTPLTAPGGAGANPDTVALFLRLLLGGAHFVHVSANDDLTSQSLTKASQSLLQAFQSTFKLDVSYRYDIGSSHYTGVGINQTGYYYGVLNQEYAPADCGLLLSLLFGRTVNVANTNPNSHEGDYNTFMQLEGWPASDGLISSTWNAYFDEGRHMADYDTFKACHWNISTYGACPYSETRGTTVFLAPEGWTPRNYQVTRMMPYVGAYAKSATTPQDWLVTDLVDIPDGTASLPSQYIDD